MTINSDVQTLEPGARVEFFTLDATAIGGGILRFHCNVGATERMFWQGQRFDLWPMEAEGFAMTAGQQPTPKLRVGNIDGSISQLCQLYDDLLGAKITRHCTFARYIDARNFDGIERVTNGDFKVDISSWTVSDAVWSDGVMAIGHAVNPSSAYQAIQTEAGKNYRLYFNLTGTTGLGSHIGTTVGGSDVLALAVQGTAGQVTRDFVGTGGVVYLRFVRGATATPSLLDEVSVREIGVNATANADEHFPDEIWFIERRGTETIEAVEFELSSPLNFQGIRIPRRVIVANQCTYEYRQEGCEYAGGPVADITDTPTSDPLLDNCGKRLQSCKLRDWPGGILNFGGWPAAGLVRT